MKSVGLYKLLVNEKLGEGSLGKSLKAVHQTTQQQVVMRIISKNKFHQSKHVKQSLKAQIKYLSSIQCQNIAAFVDILQTGNNLYILRELCNGGSLREMLNKNERIPEPQVRSILVQILKAMLQLIKKGIIHKNLIPENILFHQGTVKLSDFGIQKINYQIFQHKSCMTKSEYKSPELLQGAKGNFKCDVWSLGIILYQMLYRQHPWPSYSQKQLKINILKEKLKFPHDVEVSSNMKKFIMSCLMVDVNQRAEWSQILQSNLLQEAGIPKLQNCNEKYSFIFSVLKSSVIASNLDIQRYFKSQGMTLNNQLNRKTFAALIKPMSPQITDQQIQFLYVKLDKNGDDLIQLNQFEEAMRQFQIPLQSSYRRKAEKLLKAKNMDKELQLQQKTENELSIIYQSLIQNIQKKQIYDLYDVFTQSDKKKVGKLQYDQFVQLLRKIDKSLTKTECQKLFIAFDKNGDKKISFNQFFATMCKITGSPNGLSTC